MRSQREHDEQAQEEREEGKAGSGGEFCLKLGLSRSCKGKSLSG